MWFFSGLFPYLLVLAFFLITLLLLLDSTLLSKPLFFFMRCIDIWTNKIRKSTEKITGNNYHTTNFINIVSWSGCGSNARPPVYQTGTTKPTELPDHCWGIMNRTWNLQSQNLTLYQLRYTPILRSHMRGLLGIPRVLLFVCGLRTLSGTFRPAKPYNHPRGNVTSPAVRSYYAQSDK